MSTKTTFKRIALVAVAAMGFGVLTSVSPANAGASTSSFSVNTSSVTVVTNGTNASEVTLGAIFKVSLRNVETTAAAHVLQSGEVLTVSVVGVPAGDSSTAKTVGANAGELTLSKLAPGTDNGQTAYAAGTTWSASGATAGEISFTSSDTTAYKNNAGNTSTTGLANSYYIGVKPTSGENDVIGQGTYTLRLRLTSGSGSLLVQDTLVKVTFVNGAVNSGAILTASATGSFPAATAHSAYTLNKHIKATITDANGGVVIGEDTAGAHNIPDLTVDMVDKDGVLVTSSGLSEVDDASDADHGYTTTTTGFASAAQANLAASRNGTYGITATTSSFPTALIGATNQIRVRYGASSATGAITIINTAPATTGVASVVATGIPVTDVAPNYSLPLTTTAASVVVTGQTAGAAVVLPVTWDTTATGN